MLRKQSRHNLSTPCKVMVYNNVPAVIKDGYLTDISVGGAQVCSLEKIEKGHYLKISFDMPNGMSVNKYLVICWTDTEPISIEGISVYPCGGKFVLEKNIPVFNEENAGLIQDALASEDKEPKGQEIEHAVKSASSQEVVSIVNAKKDESIACDWHMEFYVDGDTLMYHGFLSCYSETSFSWITDKDIFEGDYLESNILKKHDGIFEEIRRKVKVTEVLKKDGRNMVQADFL